MARPTPLCKDCGKHHWNVVNCDGSHKGAKAAIEKGRERRQDVEVRERVDMPPLIQKHPDGMRPWGDRLDNWDRLGGGTLVRKQ